MSGLSVLMILRFSVQYPAKAVGIGANLHFDDCILPSFLAWVSPFLCVELKRRFARVVPMLNLACRKLLDGEEKIKPESLSLHETVFRESVIGLAELLYTVAVYVPII
ncbi:hypothetical protein Pmani_031308 [Petrolisthes manimaculis]|uniref:Uncharacterized protein n=1 Tax=Petrolisthes manimaculis TaxID=1843537 RepID=A0AAE1TV15_9EUCA|nr:hypothetical protein Pmani_031308 [Petrolisthes manimaculis]